MNGRITKIKDTFSKYGGDSSFYIFWKLADGRSARTYCAPTFNGVPMRNYAKWVPIRKRHDAGEEICLENLVIKEKDKLVIVDADSIFREYKEPVSGLYENGTPDRVVVVTWQCPLCEYGWAERVSAEKAPDMRKKIEHGFYPDCQRCINEAKRKGERKNEK